MFENVHLHAFYEQLHFLYLYKLHKKFVRVRKG